MCRDCGGRPPQYVPPPVTLIFDLLTLKVASESRVTSATSVPILIFLRLFVLDLGPMYATDRQTDRQTSDAHHRLMPRLLARGGGIISHNKLGTNSCHSYTEPSCEGCAEHKLSIVMVSAYFNCVINYWDKCPTSSSICPTSFGDLSQFS